MLLWPEYRPRCGPGARQLCSGMFTEWMKTMPPRPGERRGRVAWAFSAHEVGAVIGEAVETEGPALHERFRLIMYPSGTVVIAF